MLDPKVEKILYTMWPKVLEVPGQTGFGSNENSFSSFLYFHFCSMPINPTYHVWNVAEHRKSQGRLSSQMLLYTEFQSKTISMKTVHLKHEFKKKLSNGDLFNIFYNLRFYYLGILWKFGDAVMMAFVKSRSWVKISQVWVNLRKMYVKNSSLISSHQSCLISFLGKKEKGELNWPRCSDIGFQGEL